MNAPEPEISDFKKALSLAAAALFCCAAVFRHYLSGARMFYHDSLQAVMLPHIYYEHIFNVSLPLWSPEINAGQPLWPTLEAYPLCDPVQFAAWLFGHITGMTSALTGAVAAIGWLFVFAFGGLLLSRRITKNWWLNLTVFVLLFGGPAAWALPAQWNMLLAFRYLPFVLLLAMDFIDNPDWRRAVTLGTVTAIAMSGYQSGYMLFFALLFAAAYAFSLKLDKLLKMPPAKALCAGLMAFGAGNLVTLAAALKLLDMVAITRIAVGSWNYAAKFFLTGLLLPFFTLTKDYTGHTEHGSVMLGCAALALLPVPLARFALTRSGEPRGRALMSAWASAAIATGVLCVGPFGLEKYFTAGHYFLGLRNWGYCLPAIALALTQFSALGARQLREPETPDGRFVPCYLILFVALVALWAVCGLGETYGHPSALLFLPLPLALFFIFRVAAQKMSAQKYGILILAATTVTLCAQLGWNVNLNGEPSPQPVRIERHEAQLPQKRGGMYLARYYVPYVIMGPAFSHVYYAAMPMLFENPNVVMDLTRLARYQKLLDAFPPDSPAAQKILGVTAPILHCVSTAIPAADEADALQKLKALAPQQLDETAVIEGPLPEPAQSGAAVLSGIKVTHYEETKTALDVTVNRDAVLVYSDNWDEDWKVYLDGKPVPLLVANLTNKAVFVPAGKHTVKFEYSPLRYVLAFWLRAAFYIFAAAWAVYLLRSKNTHPENPEQ
jgi:hypothetical protein